MSKFFIIAAVSLLALCIASSLAGAGSAQAFTGLAMVQASVSPTTRFDAMEVEQKLQFAHAVF